MVEQAPVRGGRRRRKPRHRTGLFMRGPNLAKRLEAAASLYLLSLGSETIIACAPGHQILNFLRRLNDELPELGRMSSEPQL
jgi:hypothetical protein